MYHLGAFYQSVDPAGGTVNLDAVPDQSVFTSGADLRVPAGIANLLAEAALSAATTPQFGLVQSPSLRDLANQYVRPISNAVKFGASYQLQDHSASPRALVAAESLNFGINATGGAAAANYGLVFLGDGAIKPTNGNIFSVGATFGETLSAGKWVNGSLTFGEVLPAGTYQVVGMHYASANAVAARLVLVGAQFRPGCPANPSVIDNFFPQFRYGRFGVMGQFDTNQPPTLDVLGATDTSGDLVLDLIKTK